MLYWRVRPSPPSRRITKSDRKGDRAKVHECSAAVSTSLTAQTVGNEHDTCPHGGPCLKSNDARRRRTLPRTRGTGTTGSQTRTHLAPQAAAAAMYYSLCIYRQLGSFPSVPARWISLWSASQGNGWKSFICQKMFGAIPPLLKQLLTHYVVDGFWVAIEMQLFIPTTMTNPIYFFNIKVMLWVKGRKLNHFWQGMSDASREVLRRHSNPHPRELYYYILCVMELVWNGNA